MVRAVVVRPLPPQGAHGEEALTQGHGAEEAAAQPPRHFQILYNLFCLASGLFGFLGASNCFDQPAYFIWAQGGTLKIDSIDKNLQMYTYHSTGALS
jgi:hypothetical protein